MKKYIYLVITLILCISASFAQTIGVLNGPSGIPCAYLMENNAQGYEFETCASAQVELPKLIKGEIDIGFLPPNAAAKVYTKNSGALLCVGISGNGNLYLLSKNHEAGEGLSVLADKSVAVAGQGATPEYMMTYLLAKKGIENVELDFSIPNPQIAPALLSGKIDYAVVPEPFASVAQMKDSSVKVVSNIQDEFFEINKTTYPMTLVVVNAQYAKSHKKQVQQFIKDLQKAIMWTNGNPEAAGELVEKYNLGLSAAIAARAVPGCNFVWVPSKQGKKDIEMLLNLFLETAPESIGGSLPEAGFYY